MKKKIISLCLVLTMCLGLAMPVQATSISDAKKKAQELQNQKAAAEADKKELSEKLTKISKEMEDTEKKLTAKEAEIQTAEDELVTAKLDESNQYEAMKKRIKFMYENGNDEFITIMCESKSMSEFLNNAEYINQISSYDRQMLVQFQGVVKDVQDKEASLKTEYGELETLQDDLVAKKDSVNTLLEEKSVQIADLKDEIGANAETLNKLIAEAAAAAERQQQAAAAAAASSSGSSGSSGGSAGASVVSGNGQFTHPCPGSYLSSGFGYRTFDNSFHNGYDFANHGTPLPTYAAAAGTVVIAGWSNSAGNWVVINHGNGLVTKYMHHSKLFVSAGQKVSKGQNIGITGNTGASAGIHLHFQVELNGSPVNPGNYL